MAPVFIMDEFGRRVPLTYIHESHIELHHLREFRIGIRAEDSYTSATFQPISSPGRDPSLSPPSVFSPTTANTTSSIRSHHNNIGGHEHIHGPHSFKHLSIWAYLAFGFVVVTVVVLLGYTCVRCCAAHIVRLDSSVEDGRKGERKGGLEGGETKKGRKSRLFEFRTPGGRGRKSEGMEEGKEDITSLNSEVSRFE